MFHHSYVIKIFNWFIPLILSGIDNDHKPLAITWYIVAKNGDGPQIPAIPAIILTKKLLNDEMSGSGALPCVSLLTLNEYLSELKDYDIEVSTHV